METQQRNETLLPIRVVGEVLSVCSLDFAAGLGINHKSLMETIRTHQAAIESDFGAVAFETQTVENFAVSNGETKNPAKVGRPTTVAYLTDDQALFVGTLGRNSKRVVEFKATLVKSFALARKQLIADQPATPAQLSTDQVLLQLMAQSNQLLANQQQQLDSLRSDIDTIIATGKKPQPRPYSQQLRVKGTGPAPVSQQPNLRTIIKRDIDDYCDRYGYDRRDTWNYLYKRLFEVYGVNTQRLIKIGRESLLDTLERYGHLNRLHSLIRAELTYSEE